MPNPSPYMIAGSLPFNAPSVNPFQYAGSPQMALASLGPAYNSAYGNALALNAANYNNILGGYQNAVGNQVGALGDVGSGYDQLLQQVTQGIQGTQASQAQAIRDAYAKQSGQAAQDMVSRGLGNTTVQQAVQRGLTLDQQKAQTGLQNQFAQLQAGYQSQIGGAKLQAQQQAALANAALQQAQLGFMERVNAPYPDAGLYGQLAQQYGGAMQAFQDRQALLGNRPRGGIMGGAPASIGYTASGGGFPAFRAGGGGGYGGFDAMPGGGGGGIMQTTAAPLPAWNPGYVAEGGAGTFPAAAALGGYAATAGFSASPAYAGAGGGGGGGYAGVDLSDTSQDFYDAGVA